MSRTPQKSIFGNTQVRTGQVPAVIPPATSQPLTVINIQQAAGNELVMFGNDRQREFGAKLDQVLGEITKGTNNVLFELFNQLSKGVAEVNIGELEQEIIRSSQTSWGSRLLQSVGLSSAAKRLQKANERVGNMLTAKSTSLLDICNKMQATTQREVLKLVSDSQRLANLATDLRDNINVFQNYVNGGQAALDDAKQELARMQNSGAPTDKIKELEDKIQLFENRLLVLQTIVQKAPVNLEAIRIGMNASLQTLGETANSSLEDFNDIKGILIQLSVTHQTSVVQGLNDERRKLKQSLAKHSNTTLASVATKAAAAQGLNRLEDAQHLLESAKALADANTAIKAECNANKQRCAEALKHLNEVKSLIQ